MSTTSLLILTLLLAPPASDTISPDADMYQTLLGEITRITALLNEGEELGDELEAVIERLNDHAPLLAADEVGQQLRTTGLLNLARARLLEGTRAQAEVAMDEAIQLAQDRALNLADYGPALEALYEERKAALANAGTASIQIVCTVPCSAYIDGQATTLDAARLPLGVRRVWIEAATDGSSALPETHRIRLDSPGMVVQLTYAPAISPPPSVPGPPPLRWPRQRPLAHAGLATVGVGVIVTILGAALWGTGHTGEPDPLRSEYEYRNLRDPGIALTTIGFLASAVGSSMLAVDVHRHRRRVGTLSVRAAPDYAGLLFRGNF